MNRGKTIFLSITILVVVLVSIFGFKIYQEMDFPNSGVEKENLSDKETKTMFSGGSGTEEDPYRIESFDDLKNMDERVEFRNAHFEITSDIDASESRRMNPSRELSGEYLGPGNRTTYKTITAPIESIDRVYVKEQNISQDSYSVDRETGEISFESTPRELIEPEEGNGESHHHRSQHRVRVDYSTNKTLYRGFQSLFYGNKSFNPPGFNGTIEGNNHEIKNLYIHEKGVVGSGLVKRNIGVIKNLKLDVSINGSYYVGAVTGGNRKDGVIENISVRGQIQGLDCIGGIAGYNNGTIKNSFSEADIQGEREVGGIIGDQGINGSLIKSKFSPPENTDSDVEVLIGKDRGTILDSEVELRE